MHILTGCISTVPSGRTTSAGSTLQTGSSDMGGEGREGEGRGGKEDGTAHMFITPFSIDLS